MKLYIMRHGETDWNKERRLQGQSDIELNDYGRELAYKTRDGLKEVPFDFVITSPLKRARETAEIVKGERDIPIIEDARIKEMSFGAYEGLRCKGENCDIPKEIMKAFFEEPENYQAPQDGEDFETFCRRIKDFLQELYEKEEYQDSTILITVHGAVIRAVLRAIKDTPLHSFWEGGVYGNCAALIVKVTDGKPLIERENALYYDDEVEVW